MLFRLKKRRPLFILSALSLLLLVLLYWGWRRSDRAFDILYRWQPSGHGVSIEAKLGEINIEWSTVHDVRDLKPGALGLHRRVEESVEPRLSEYMTQWSHSQKRFAGILLYSVRWADCDGSGLVIPYEWPVFLAFLLPLRCALVVWLNALHRRRTYQQKYCAACGYDLRASTEYCPECGTEHPRRKAYELAALHRQEFAEQTRRVLQAPKGKRERYAKAMGH